MSSLSFQFTNSAEQQLALPPAKLKCHHEEPYLITRLGRTLHHHLTVIDSAGSRSIVIICIGTDRSTGDSLGPLVGTHLAELDPSLSVFGTLSKPVHATNLQETLDEIKLSFDNPLIIAVDACLGRSESVGTITLASGVLKPGTGVNKNLPHVGDVHFTGIVNVGGYMEYFVLQNTRLGLVWRMANIIAAGIQHGILLTTRQRQKIDLTQSLQ